jgi:hypothetical protein
MKKIDIAVILALMALAIMVNGLSAGSAAPTPTAPVTSAAGSTTVEGDDGDEADDQSGDDQGDDGADDGSDTEESATPGTPA